MSEKLRCDCKDFKESFQQIIDAQIFCATRSYLKEYTGARFIYCPWCGKKLIEEIEKK